MPILLPIAQSNNVQRLFQENAFWMSIGLAALVLFNGRWIVQWIQSELKKESHVPISFWWQSLVGAVLYTAYGIHKRDSVFIVAYGSAVIPCARNLILIYRKRRQQPAGGGGDH
jgi:lipid-A-disaccharide synthase-like uncharacterized protein